MVLDLGSRDDEFIAMNQSMRDRLLAIAHAEESHVCVPLQGSGTFIVEATLATLVPKDGKLLVLVNGAYGHRMVKMMQVMGRAVDLIEWPEDEPVEASCLDQALQDDPSISHVAVVHCETTSGILNPIDNIAAVTARHDKALIIDAMSAFGALALDARHTRFDAVMASSNKCLEGVPGMGFAIIRKDALEASSGHAHSLSLDLYAQWTYMEQKGQWRFTPPIQVIAALSKALDQFEEEGGQQGRHNRYQENADILMTGMKDLGFQPLLSDTLQAPIILTFLTPKDEKFVFEDFYNKLKDKGFIIYPGKLTKVSSFRVGCIGHVDANDIKEALQAIKQALSEMGVQDGAP